MPPAIRVQNIFKCFTLGRTGLPLSNITERTGMMARDTLRKVKQLLRPGGPATDNVYWAVKDVTFDVNPGEVVGLLGRNGAGKSQFMKLITRAMTGTEIDGVRVAASLKLGATDQEMSQLPASGTPFDFIASFGEGDQRSKSLLAGAGFPIEKQGRPITQLSFGQRARLSLLALRLSAPNFYLLDEPTNHVDITGQERLEAEILEHEATTILVSHDRSLVRNIGTRFFEIVRGKLVEVDSPEPFFLSQSVTG